MFKSMQQFVQADRGISAVIGVIMMIAITVIVAGVIGTFVLGETSGLQSKTPPQTQFAFNGEPGGLYSIVHEGGDSFQAANVKVVIQNDTATTVDTSEYDWNSGNDIVDSGDAYKLTEVAQAGERIRIVWSAPGGGKSSTIGEFRVPPE